MDNSARFHGYLKEFLQIMQDLHIAALGGISWEVPIAFSVRWHSANEALFRYSRQKECQDLANRIFAGFIGLPAGGRPRGWPA